MPSFGTRSEYQLNSGVHPNLVATARDVIEWYDHSVVEGFRTAQRQAMLYASGYSQRPPGKSAHERTERGLPCSFALDVYPYPLSKEEWADFVKLGRADANMMSRFSMLHGAYIQAGRSHGLILRSGLDWDRDGQALGKGFLDAAHVEIVGFL